MSYAAYAHPAFMFAVLVLGLHTLWLGIALRRARIARRPLSSERHRRAGRWLALLVSVGFASGLASMARFGKGGVFGSAHALLASLALLGLLSGAAVGLYIERRGRAVRLRGIHAALAAMGMLVALAAGVAGFAILP